MAAGSRGSSRQAARERAFRLLAVAVSALFLAFAALGGAFFWYDHAAGMLAHAHQVRAELEGLRQSLTEAESAHRAYVLTGRPRFAEQVEAARADAETRFVTLKALTADSPDQSARLTRLRALMDTHLTVIDQTVAARKAGAERCYIEDESPDAMRQVPASLAYLKKLEY